MRFFLSFTPSAKESLKELKYSAHLEKRYKAVCKALKFLEENPRHPSLRTHEYFSIKGPNGEKVFEAYAEQNTPSAYRIFFFYGTRNHRVPASPVTPGIQKGEIVIFAVTPHP